MVRNRQPATDHIKLSTKAICQVTETVLAESSELFKVLGDPTRMRVICILLQGEQCVHELAGQVDMSQSAISHQLRVLRQARLVRHRRQGRHALYALADDHVRRLIELAIEHTTEQDQP